MTRNLFSVPIFFIVFRETLEAAIIVSVLLGLVEQIVYDTPAGSPLVGHRHAHTATTGGSTTLGGGGSTAVSTSGEDEKREDGSGSGSAHAGAGTDTGVSSSSAEELPGDESTAVRNKKLIRKLRVQIFAGTLLGFLLAVAIGAAFIAVWFTKAADLWQKTEELWEGIFELIASLIIFAMGISVLKLDRAKAKWRVKLMRAFEHQKGDRSGKTGRWVLFLLPLITVLREGMEAVIFVGGVSLGQPAASIPIATVVGIVAGLVCGVLIYAFASRTTLTIFLIVMTNFILLIGAGLFSRAISAFQENAFNHLLGQDVDDAGGTGPGSYDVRGNVWHLDCCNPEATTSGQGWTIFNALFGWSNNASLGSVLGYVGYWVAVFGALVWLKWKEGRLTFFGYESAGAKRRRGYVERTAASGKHNASEPASTSAAVPDLAHEDTSSGAVHEKEHDLPR